MSSTEPLMVSDQLVLLCNTLLICASDNELLKPQSLTHNGSVRH